MNTETFKARHLLILALLRAYPHGLRGSDLIRLTRGILRRGTVYGDLQDLRENQCVRDEEIPYKENMPLYKHYITPAGQHQLKNFLVGKPPEVEKALNAVLEDIDKIEKLDNPNDLP